MNKSPCIVCGGFEHISLTLPAFDGSDVQVSVCSNCQLSSPTWPVAVDPIAEHFDFYMEREEEWNATSDSLLVMGDQLRFWLNRTLPVGEVGAGSGALASAITRLGYWYIGSEPGALCLEARRHFALDEMQLRHQNYAEYFAQLKEEGITLGTLFLWHVLEHVADPDELMRLALDSLLNPLGKVLIQVPNMSTQWLYPQHVHFFAGITFEHWAEKYGAAVRLVEADDVRGFKMYVLEKTQ